MSRIQALFGRKAGVPVFTFFVTAAVLYLALTSLSNKVFDKAEIWANRGVRRA